MSKDFVPELVARPVARRTEVRDPEADMTVRFPKDIANHAMTVALDEGLYRHLQFRNREHGWNFWFDLITVPGALIFQGDGDSFVFHRVDDMFTFFRGPVGRINPGYWWEKVQDRREHVKTYHQELLEQHVTEEVAAAVERHGDTLAGLAGAVRLEVLDCLCGDESHDRGLVEAFEYYSGARSAWASGPPDFTFTETYEWNVRDFDWWFRWACHAIVWGIAQYDAHKAAAAVES